MPRPPCGRSLPELSLPTCQVPSGRCRQDPGAATQPLGVSVHRLPDVDDERLDPIALGLRRTRRGVDQAGQPLVHLLDEGDPVRDQGARAGRTGHVAAGEVPIGAVRGLSGCRRAWLACRCRNRRNGGMRDPEHLLEVPELIRTARASAGLTQRQLATVAGTSRRPSLAMSGAPSFLKFVTLPGSSSPPRSWQRTNFSPSPTASRLATTSTSPDWSSATVSNGSATCPAGRIPDSIAGHSPTCSAGSTGCLAWTSRDDATTGRSAGWWRVDLGLPLGAQIELAVDDGSYNLSFGYTPSTAALPSRAVSSTYTEPRTTWWPGG